MSSEVGPGPQYESDPIRSYYLTLVDVLKNPVSFFRALPSKGGLGIPLTFALVTHWIGRALEYMVGSVLGLSGSQLFNWLVQKMKNLDLESTENINFSIKIDQSTAKLEQWMAGPAGVIVDPFITLIGVFLFSFVVFIAARILITPGTGGNARPITFEACTRVTCYATAPSIFLVFPVIGGTLFWIFEAILLIVGCREMFRTTTLMGIVVTFIFPKVLLFGAGILALPVLIVGFMGLVSFLSFL